MAIGVGSDLSILTLLHTVPVILAATALQFADLSETGGAGPIPLGSRQSWINIQQESNVNQVLMKEEEERVIPERRKRKIK
jgi:hypothetical protein